MVQVGNTGVSPGGNPGAHGGGIPGGSGGPRQPIGTGGSPDATRGGTTSPDPIGGTSNLDAVGGTPDGTSIATNPTPLSSSTGGGGPTGPNGNVSTANIDLSWREELWAVNGPMQDMGWLVGASALLGCSIVLAMLSTRFLEFVQGRARHRLDAEFGAWSLSIISGAIVGVWALGWRWRQPRPFSSELWLVGPLNWPKTFSQPLFAISLLVLVIALVKYGMAIQIARQKGALARATALERGSAGAGMVTFVCTVLATLANIAAIYAVFPWGG